MNSMVIRSVMVCLMALTLWGCSSSRHVPQGSYLLDDVDIVIDDSSRVKEADLVNYLRQAPNHKVLGFLKLQLATYNMSGRDTTRWYNRWLRRLGQPPVIYDPSLTDASAKQLRQALINKGYMGATVQADTLRNDRSRKVKVDYMVHPGAPHYISSVTYDIPDTLIERIIMADTASLNLRPGNPFDRSNLDEARALITQRLRNRGYYAFIKEYITFYADTAAGSRAIDLTLTVRPPRTPARLTAVTDTAAAEHHRYRVGRVIFVTDARPGTSAARFEPTAGSDTVSYHNIQIIYGPDHYLRPSVLEEKCFITPGRLYRASDLDRTYEALSQLGIVRSINIEMQPTGTVDGTPLLDAYIFLQRNKKQAVSFEVEGTNSEGDLGFGLGLTYQHRDLGNRSNLLSAKFRTTYESLSGNLSDLINDRYTEQAAEVGITFPRFMFPFMSRSYTRRIKASTELSMSFSYQERPEYTRIIAGAAWKYKWTTRRGRNRNTFDVVDINYVYLPRSTIDFINQIAPSNPLLRYSYEDHFIMRMGYSLYRTNKRMQTDAFGARRLGRQHSIYSLRAAAETAGNLLYGISSLSGQKRSDGVYKVFGIQYAQYAKADFDFSQTYNFGERHSLALHAGAGVAVPYGNSRVVPFEKRFYAGGANSVRGWSVRSLGPGSFDSRNSVSDFINQCGDIRLDLNAEYRTKLFWVLESALFIDAGNIWTIHNYENQPGGMFHFDSFARQIAWSYGVGLRLDFSYFLLRLDLGVKAYNPATNQEHWPLIHPRWGRDTAFHFSVGYPF